MPTPFFQEIGDRLARAGHHVHKVHYTAGDALFWRNLPATRFTGTSDTLAGFYRNIIDQHQVDTLILFGDCREIHLPAIEEAKQRGLTLYVCEEGYIRPGWITFEKGGSNNKSNMPRTLTGIRAILQTLTRTQEKANAQNDLGDSLAHIDVFNPQRTYGNPMPARVRMDLMNIAASLLNPVLYPAYKTHRPETKAQEAWGWIKKLANAPFIKNHHSQLAKRYELTETDFFLVPLQLNSDYQIRANSSYASVTDFIEEILQSFAVHAKGKDRLLIKLHPLDNGRINYARFIQRHAKAHGISDRVDFLIGGNLEEILSNCKGVVLVNSTTGFAALRHLKPVKVTGRAFYDMADITFSGTLDEFWTSATAPAKEDIKDFMKVVIATTQIPGDLFTHEGLTVAADAAVTRLLADRQSLQITDQQKADISL
ncbi:capsular polysaccharide export protein [Kordiimonas sediminis]|uniref:Capsular polysaccharide export protein n=2 Tax=Kordiimonas sediminis TaxID=1735581 RepID=A0A919E4A8_9PROT|nr:capsular polysaccharide export protein [Kordiimonas sediminis]